MTFSRGKSKAAFLREFGVTDPKKIQAGFTWLRYKNPPEKGVYWYYVSLYVRHRDVQRYGTCISCLRPITVDTCDAGHFMPAEDCGRDLLFDLQNINAECGRCNAWDSTHLLGYAENLDKRYGDGTAAALRRRRSEYKAGPPVKDWKPKEYEAKIMSIRKALLEEFGYPQESPLQRTSDVIG